MVNYYIESVESAEKLSEICRKFKDEDINVLCGRFVIDGKSFLGVMSLIGKRVSLEILTDNKNIQEKFEEEINNEI